MNDNDNKYAHRYNADTPLRIGTRQSPLAMVQTQMVRAALIMQYKMPQDAIVIIPMLASGDKITDRPLADIGGKALWTKELERAQLDNEIDIAVHSMKDVETIRPDHYCIAAMLPRANISDSLIGAPSLQDLPQGAKVGTSSPRRKAQLLSMRPDLRCEDIRGNVATRLRKIEDGEFDATLLATAGLERLNMGNIGCKIDTMLPAASQGAIGIECLSKHKKLQKFLSAINHPDTMDCVDVERAFLASLSGDCHSPIAAHATIEGHDIRLEGQILSPDGSEQQSGHIIAPRQDAIQAAHGLATQLLAQSSAKLQSYFGHPQ